MFGRVDFREDGEKGGEKMRREIFLKSVWLGGEERKMMVRLGYFHLRPIKKFSFQNREKTELGKFGK